MHFYIKDILEIQAVETLAGGFYFAMLDSLRQRFKDYFEL
jgi:hypothetical protein